MASDGRTGMYDMPTQPYTPFALGDRSPGADYFAYDTARVSRITVIFTWPG